MVSGCHIKRVTVILVVFILLGLLLSGPAFGQSGVFEVIDPNLPPDDAWSWDVALGDVDGDLDIVVANYGDNRLYTNNGRHSVPFGLVGCELHP